MGEVTVHLEIGNRRVMGRGASTDIIEASAKALSGRSEPAELIRGMNQSESAREWGDSWGTGKPAA
jgi:hypothetical protein